MEQHINFKEIVFIDVYKKKENRNFQYNIYKKLFGFITIFKDGWYDCSNAFDIKFICKETYLLNDNMIPENTYFDLYTSYYFPHVVYNMSNGRKITKFFETETLLNKHVEFLYTKIELNNIKDII